MSKELIASQNCISNGTGKFQDVYREDDKYIILTKTWIPKFQHFHPPMIRLFRWAYRLHQDEHIEYDEKRAHTQIGVILRINYEEV